MIAKKSKKVLTMAVALMTAFTVGSSIVPPLTASATSKTKTTITTIVTTISTIGKVSKPAQVKNLTVSQVGTTALRLKFKKIPGATGYQIYQSIDKYGDYKKVKTLKSGKTTIYTKTNLKPDNRYYYKVRAYKVYKVKKGKKTLKKTVYGRFSASKGAWTDIVGKPSIPGKVPNTKLAITNGTMRLTFDKVEGADGYRVYQRDYINWRDGYQAVATIKPSEPLFYTAKDLQIGVTYYYCVKAYKTYQQHKKTKYVYSDKADTVYDYLTENDVIDPPYRELDMELLQNDLLQAQRSGEIVDRSVNSKPYVGFHKVTPDGNATVGYIGKWAEECSQVDGTQPGRWYGANFGLKLATEEVTAYYTIDGSTPSTLNGIKVTKYDGRVKIRNDKHTGSSASDKEVLDLKIHFYVNGRLVALKYVHNAQATCFHGYAAGDGTD